MARAPSARRWTSSRRAACRWSRAPATTRRTTTPTRSATTTSTIARTSRGGAEYLAIKLEPGPATIYLSWDEFGRACGTTDLDAYVYDEQGNVVGRSTNEQDRDADNCEPVERPRVDAPEEGWYYLSVVRKAGAANGVRFQVLSQDGNIYRAVPEGSVTDPGSSPTVLTVGAVDAVGYLDNLPRVSRRRVRLHRGSRSRTCWGPTV
jgi:hypothetical protein